MIQAPDTTRHLLMLEWLKRLSRADEFEVVRDLGGTGLQFNARRGELTTKFRTNISTSSASQALAEVADFMGQLLDEQEGRKFREQYDATPNDPIPVLWEAAGL